MTRSRSNEWLRALGRPVLRIYCTAGRGRRLIGAVTSVPGKGLVLHRCSGAGVLLVGRSPTFTLPCRCSVHVVELEQLRAVVRAGATAARVADDGRLHLLGLGHSSTRDAPAAQPPKYPRKCEAHDSPGAPSP